MHSRIHIRHTRSALLVWVTRILTGGRSWTRHSILLWLRRPMGLAGLWYPRVGGHTSILWASCARHPVVGWVGRVTSLSSLWVPLGVATFHLWILSRVARLPRVVLWNALLLRVCRVLAWEATSVTWVSWTRSATLIIITLRHWLAWMAVHLLLHLLLLLPAHISWVALLTRVSWLARLALVTWITWLTLTRTAAAWRIARRCSRTI